MADYYFDIETTGLNPFEHKILTIQLKRENDITVWKLWEEKDEISLIARLFDNLRNIDRFDSICGYNCLQFDIPFIASRLAIHGAMDNKNYQVLYNRNWIDLYQYLGGNYISMDKWLRYFAVERQCPFKGVHVPHLYAEKRFAEIEEHAAEDLVLCEKLMEKLSENHGDHARSQSIIHVCSKES